MLIQFWKMFSMLSSTMKMKIHPIFKSQGRILGDSVIEYVYIVLNPWCTESLTA